MLHCLCRTCTTSPLDDDAAFTVHVHTRSFAKQYRDVHIARVARPTMLTSQAPVDGRMARANCVGSHAR